MLRPAIVRKRPELWANNSWLLYHNNGPAHSAIATWQFLAKTSTTGLEHCAYSPDLAPNDFFLYSKTKEVPKRAHFQSEEVIKRRVRGHEQPGRNGLLGVLPGMEIESGEVQPSGRGVN